MYNPELKKQFLDIYIAKSQPIYERVFGFSEAIETELQKDLYNFNILEIQKVLEILDPKYVSTSRTNGRIISAYIKWATNEGLRKDSTNPLEDVRNYFFEQFVDKANILPYFTKDEIWKIIKFCENAQDAVIMQLLFEGVQGKENAEIRNLKEEHINFDTQELLLTDDKGEVRTLTVTIDCLKLIDEALSEATYYKRNGIMDDAPSNVRRYTDLVDNSYVVRSSVTRTESINHPVDKFVIYRRIALASELLVIPKLNAKNIVRSGMIYQGYKVLKEHGVLDKVAYANIAERFQVKTMPALKEIVNKDTISSLYDDEVL